MKKKRSGEISSRVSSGCTVANRIVDECVTKTNKIATISVTKYNIVQDKYTLHKVHFVAAIIAVFCAPVTAAAVYVDTIIS